MYRGTTPRITFTLDTSVDLSTVEEAWVTFKTATTEVTKCLSEGEVGIDASETQMFVELAQEETLSLYSGVASVQIRFRTQSGKAYATEVKQVNVGKILKEGVI